MSEWESAIARARAGAIDRIAEALRSLIQEKHLYQSISITFDDVLPDMPPDKNPFTAQMKYLRDATRRPWSLLDPQNPPKATNDWLLYVKPPDVKLFCAICDRIEAFNLISVEEFFAREKEFSHPGEPTQAFVLSYRCQSCKSVPEVFLVRRNGFKLTNTGRSPIEHVDVPSAIPKSVRRFYGGVIVAHQSGQTLAALFLLRTLIEQYGRASTKVEGLADQVLDAYMKSLPDDFKGRFPSMRDLYGTLSDDIHAAKGSAELFERARREIEEHFRARELFKIPDVPSAVSAS